MEIIKRNLFTKLRADNFKTGERLEPMSNFKTRKMIGMLRNIADMPAGEVMMANPLLNRRLKHLQEKERLQETDRKSTRLNSSHANISYAVFCLKKKKEIKLKT